MKRDDVVMDKQGNIYLVDEVSSPMRTYVAGEGVEGRLVYYKDEPKRIVSCMLDKFLTKIG